MYKIVLLRHGQTTYNKEKIFCGWTDVDLTEQGIQEAKTAGQYLKSAGFTFDVGYCSVLKRAKETLRLTLKEMDADSLPVQFTWKLNERHYGALQGEKHEEIAAKHSPDQVKLWRRSFSVKPPQLEETDPRHPCTDPLYCDIDKKDLPCGESLEDTIARVLPYWEEKIVPEIKADKQVIISASGNSIRALVKSIEGISDDDIVGLEIKNGTPLIFMLDENMKGVERYYLGENGAKIAV